MTPSAKRPTAKPRPIEFNVEEALSIESRLTTLETKANIFQWFLGLVLGAGALRLFHVWFSS